MPSSAASAHPHPDLAAPFELAARNHTAHLLELLSSHRNQRLQLVCTIAWNHVRTPILLCMLAYYVEWHMREAWQALLFADEDQAAKAKRDPVAPARRSHAAVGQMFAARSTDENIAPGHLIP